MFKTNLRLRTFAFIMNWIKYHVVSSFVTYGSFLCQHEASKIKNTIVRNSFSAVVYTALNITHTIEKPIAALSVSSENFFPLVLHERAPLTVLLRLYPVLPKTALPTAQSSFTKSNDGTVSAHHFRLQKRKV